MKEQTDINILLIEDNPGDAFLIREMIEDVRRQRVSLCHAATLSEGCDKLSGGPFDIVLLDLVLPDSAGTESIEAIKSMSPELPIVMLTGLDDEETAVSCLKMGAQDYLVKGQIDTDLLLRSVRYAIERKRAAENIESKQRFIQHIADTTPDILYIFDITRHYLVYANNALVSVLGYSTEEINLFGESLYRELAHPEDLSKVHDYIGNLSAAEDDTIIGLECRVKHHNGRWRWIDFNSVVFARERDGSVKEVLGTAHDITSRKEREQQIRSSLEEKELLLREIHHRVKNNMTVIFSLLKLQSRHVKDERDRELFEDSMARIKTMSIIHEKLYRSKNLAVINFGDYISELTGSMFMSYRIPSDRIRLKTEVDNVSLGIDSAIPCGLIVNELLSNSLKYAFPDNRKGEISVALRETGDLKENAENRRSSAGKHNSTIELVVSDNGTGMPLDIDISKSDSLGLSIVNALVSQLHGKIEVSREKGTEFRIRFNK